VFALVSVGWDLIAEWARGIAACCASCADMWAHHTPYFLGQPFVMLSIKADKGKEPGCREDGLPKMLAADGGTVVRGTGLPTRLERDTPGISNVGGSRPARRRIAETIDPLFQRTSSPPACSIANLAASGMRS